MEYMINEWDKLLDQYKATKDTGPICRAWHVLCDEFGEAGEKCIEFFNADPSKQKAAQEGYKKIMKRMDDFRKKFFNAPVG
jgi:hypothetical protein